MDLHKIILAESLIGLYEWTILPISEKYEPSNHPDGIKKTIREAVREANKKAKADGKQIAFTYLERRLLKC